MTSLQKSFSAVRFICAVSFMMQLSLKFWAVGWNFLLIRNIFLIFLNVFCKIIHRFRSIHLQS